MENMKLWNFQQLADFFQKIGQHEAARIVSKYKIPGTTILQFINEPLLYKKLLMANSEKETLKICLCQLKTLFVIKGYVSEPVESKSKINNTKEKVPPKNEQPTMYSIEQENTNFVYFKTNRLFTQQEQVYTSEEQEININPSRQHYYKFCHKQEYQKYERVPTVPAHVEKKDHTLNRYYKFCSCGKKPCDEAKPHNEFPPNTYYQESSCSVRTYSSDYIYAPTLMEPFDDLIVRRIKKYVSPHMISDRIVEETSYSKVINLTCDTSMENVSRKCNLFNCFSYIFGCL